MTGEAPFEAKRLKHPFISGERVRYKGREDWDPLQGLAGRQSKAQDASAEEFLCSSKESEMELIELDSDEEFLVENEAF